MIGGLDVAAALYFFVPAAVLAAVEGVVIWRRRRRRVPPVDWLRMGMARWEADTWPVHPTVCHCGHAGMWHDGGCTFDGCPCLRLTA